MSKKKEQGRFSSRRKTEAVLRLIRGEDLDALSRELGVTAATLSSWREAFVAGGQSNLKSREASAADDENQQLKALVGDLTMKLTGTYSSIGSFEKSTSPFSRPGRGFEVMSSTLNPP